MSVKEKLSSKMKSRGFNVPRLSSESGVPLQTIKGIIYGSSKGSPQTIIKLAKTLQCTMEELVNDEAENLNKRTYKDSKLYDECVEALNSYMTEKQLNFSKDKTCKIIENLITLYSKKKAKGSDYIIDDATIEWIIENI